MRAFARRRYIGSDGQKHTEFALDRRDTSPRYEGQSDTARCPYCWHGWAHSSALHERMTAREDEAKS